MSQKNPEKVPQSLKESSQNPKKYSNFPKVVSKSEKSLKIINKMFEVINPLLVVRIDFVYLCPDNLGQSMV